MQGMAFRITFWNSSLYIYSLLHVTKVLLNCALFFRCRNSIDDIYLYVLCWRNNFTYMQASGSCLTALLQTSFSEKLWVLLNTFLNTLIIFRGAFLFTHWKTWCIEKIPFSSFFSKQLTYILLETGNFYHDFTFVSGNVDDYQTLVIPMDTAAKFQEIAACNTVNNIETCGILAGRLVGLFVCFCIVGRIVPFYSWM